MKKSLTTAAALLGLTIVATEGRASDHIDGLKTSVDNAADLTDVFAFVSPQDSSKLVVILNVHPSAFSGSQFSDAVDYKIRIRPVGDTTTLLPVEDASQESSIVCDFAAPPGADGSTSPAQQATCVAKLTGGTDTVSFSTRTSDYRAGGSGQSGGTRVFAGVRSDPWFLDLAKVLAYNAWLPVPSTPGINGLQGSNVLSIVAEVSISSLPGPLLAVTAQTVRK